MLHLPGGYLSVNLFRIDLSDSLPPEDFPQYVPPANDERLVLNAWLGPAGTVSPAHTVSSVVPSIRALASYFC